ncbi:tRNA ligase [Microsporum audouinii]
MAQQDAHQVLQLVQRLEAAQKKQVKRAFSCKKSTFSVTGSDITVDSWRFQDWDYKKGGLPTYARGLFTTVNRAGKPEIAVRGYDKFFNIEEVNSTRWRNIEDNTRGPYELSVKENGCIIFISGLEDGTLLVCSKHSTGSRQDMEMSHAEVGRAWVKRHVESVGKTERDLARELRSMNATAVGELCDDSFEEHVLAYSEEESGIYLHGINYNLPEFATVRSSDVHRFADTWGFKKAQFLVKDDITSVREFLEGCAETGSWDGRDTEGFVIRCQMRESNALPYQDWFFKYKFEEPYLMYRQWREATKKLISGKVPTFRKHVKISEEYLKYARKQLAKDPKLGKRYNQNHGIIAMRDGFLKERGLKGSEIIAMEAAEGEELCVPQDKDFVLVPIASIGCGKTTVAVALVKLFGWGHFQNDNVEGKGNRPKRFVQGLIGELNSHSCVIADRNNHQKREREQLFTDMQALVPDAHFIALHWVHEPKKSMLDDIRRVTQQRVLDRGDNHQTIRAGSKSESEILQIMEGFLRRFEAVDTGREPDSQFEGVIDLDVAASSRENLETIVDYFYANYPKLMKREKPDASELDAAIKEAMESYTVDIKHDLSFQGKSKGQQQPPQHQNQHQKLQTPDQLVKKIEYFNISVPSAPIKSTLASIFDASPSSDYSHLYRLLTNSRRIQPSFHVTLIHRASSADQPDTWRTYTDLYKQAIANQAASSSAPSSTGSNSGGGGSGVVSATVTGTPTPRLGTASVRLETLVWDKRIMAIVARILPGPTATGVAAASATPGEAEEGELLPTWPCANEIAHVTIGTANASVKPKESNDLLKRWLEMGAGEQSGIWEARIPSVKVVEGVVGVVMRR